MKNKEILLDVIGDTNEKLVPELTAKKKKINVLRWTALGGACAAAVIACVTVLPKMNGENAKLPTTSTTPATTTAPETISSPETTKEVSGDPAPVYFVGNEATMLAEAAYPEMPKYPEMTGDTNWEDVEADIEKWQNAINELREQPDGYQDGFDTFFLNSTQTFLNGSDTDNCVYSPLSLYMALGMSAEITDGNSRQQILDVLAQGDIDTLRAHAKSIWQANYLDDGLAKSVLATSLWTRNDAEYKQDAVNRLSDTYYTSVFSGDPSSEDYNNMYRDWLNAQTDGLLGDQVAGLNLDPEMIMTLASTVNFSGKWEDKFEPEKTKQADFHAAGGDVKCDFMNAERVTGYYWGDKFTSINLHLENNGQMRLILPDEGYSPYDLLKDDETKKFMLNFGEYENSKYVVVDMSVPKFDVTSKIDLSDGLRSLGITDIFDGSKSDFTPLTESVDSIFIDKAEQDTRVTIDEEGCKAIAMTIIGGKGGGAPDERVEFVLDRPFVFEIMSSTGLPLFVGVVNNPAQ